MMLKCVYLFAIFFFFARGLIVEHDFTSGLKPYSYQTFSGIAMYSKQDSPSSHKNHANGRSYIHLDLDIYRTEANNEAELEIIIIPDTNINDIGIHDENNIHLCCNEDLIKQNLCTTKNRLIIPKNITGLYRYFVNFEQASTAKHIVLQDDIIVTNIHVFAMASCSENLGIVTFEGKSVWMNPYGHLPGDLYGYLPFYGWMCITYLAIACVWLCFNALYWTELLYVQNCITCVLAMCLVEMATWYFDYLHLNQKGIRHHGPFITGLIVTITRRTISRMLVVAVSMGYGVAKPTLGPVKWKIIGLGIIYWIFAFMFEALIHYNQTEKVETWLRVILIPPVAILNGIFWWWTFVSLNHTIEYLKIKKQSAKLQLYKSFTIVLVISLIAAIAFAIYELYYVLKELYFAQWQRLWFMEVGFWQIMFSIVLVAIMILWRPSEHSKTYAYVDQLLAVDDDDDEENEDSENGSDHLNKPDTIGDDDHNTGKNMEPKFIIDDEEDDHDIEKHPPIVTEENLTAKVD